MKSGIKWLLAAAAGTVFAFTAPGHGFAQQKSLKQQLVGVWTYVSIEDVQSDGTRTQPYGTTPNGIAVFDRSGQFAIILTRPDIPKYAANNRLKGTTEEYSATAKGSFSQFGTYTVDETAHSFILHVTGSSYPNIIGTDRKERVTSITPDKMTWTIGDATGGGSGNIVLKRTK